MKLLVVTLILVQTVYINAQTPYNSYSDLQENLQRVDNDEQSDTKYIVAVIIMEISNTKKPEVRKPCSTNDGRPKLNYKQLLQQQQNKFSTPPNLLNQPRKPQPTFYLGGSKLSRLAQAYKEAQVKESEGQQTPVISPLGRESVTD